MKSLKRLIEAVAFTGILTVSSLVVAADQPQGNAKDQKLKPYTLQTCAVSGEKLGEMGDPYVHKHQDREIKFCCKSCLKDFNKEPAKYVKKIEEAEKSGKGGKCCPHGHSGHKN